MKSPTAANVNYFWRWSQGLSSGERTISLTLPAPEPNARSEPQTYCGFLKPDKIPKHLEFVKAGGPLSGASPDQPQAPHPTTQRRPRNGNSNPPPSEMQGYGATRRLTRSPKWRDSAARNDHHCCKHPRLPLTTRDRALPPDQRRPQRPRKSRENDHQMVMQNTGDLVGDP